MGFGTPFVTNAPAAELAEPGQTALHRPPEPPQAVLLRPAPACDAWLDASASEFGADMTRVVSLVGHQRARTLPWAATAGGGPPHGRHGIDEFQHYLTVIGVCRGELDRQRDALSVGQKVASSTPCDTPS